MKNCLLTLSFVVLWALHCRGETEKSYDCPNFTEISALDTAATKALIRETVNGIWASSVFETETPLLTKFIDSLLEISNIDSDYFTGMALEFSGWALDYLKHAERIYPSFCSFAKAINKSLEWKEKGDSELYLEALNSSFVTVNITISGIIYGAMQQIGCKNVSQPIRDTGICWDNGFAFCIEKVWDAFGHSVPWVLKQTVDELFLSDIFIERATATVFSFSLIPAVHYVWASTNITNDLQYLSHYTNANQSVSKCCCPQWLSRMVELSQGILQLIEDGVVAKVNEVANECH